MPAVFDRNGHLVCATTSTHPYAGCALFNTSSTSTLYPGINSYAEAYFGGNGQITRALHAMISDI